MDTTSKNTNSTADANVPVRLNRDSSSSSILKGDINSSNPMTQTTRSTPLNSRETSPKRPVLRPGAKAASTGTRSRKNSQTDISPSRLAKANTLPPSTTANKISSNTISAPQSVSAEPNTQSPAIQRSPTATEHLKDSPRWPISPRLRSPPPLLNNRPNILGPPSRKADQDLPLINVQRSTPSPQPDVNQAEFDPEDNHLQPGMKPPARGASGGSTTTLETVQEVSPLASPLDEPSEKVEDSNNSEAGSQADPLEISTIKTSKSRANPANTESGSESGSVKGDRKPRTTKTTPPLATRLSSLSAKQNATKAKPSEGSVQNMTVETETVTSIPQVSLAPTAGKEGPNGTLRAKPSSETIRPKKDKRKTMRKQPTVTSGTASSKADIFEAKIASAVDEADTSDSEETFVYDSNPPEADRPRRFHSRTPSATSMVSNVDRPGMRTFNSIMENGGPSAAMRKSMKFVNAFNSNGNDSAIVDEEGKGTARSIAGSARGPSGTARVHHHHFGRWGRNGNGNGHTSLFDNEAPFHINAATAQRSKFPTSNSRQSSQPPSPRFSNSGRISVAGNRAMQMGTYDMDDTTGADDERTPLIPGSMRSARSGRMRRQPVSLRNMENQTYRSTPTVLNRFASCLVLTVMLLLVISGAIGFIFATTMPLTAIELKNISNVLASEQELMFDLTVKAHNPNVVVVIIDSADLEVFAKSPYAGTDSEWWRRPKDSETFAARRKRNTEVNALNEPLDDLPVDDHSPNMRLGTIQKFDTSLTFEGSFFNQGLSSSIASVRLRRPGNSTDNGTERWERVMQEEFDLIVKGVLKYSLPLSQRVRSVAINGRTRVKPNSANDPTLRPNETEVSISQQRQ